MEKRIERGIITFVILFFCNCFSYIYKEPVMLSVLNKKTNHRQTIVGWGDFHDKDHPANNQQRLHIDSVFKRCALLKGKVKVIVEDLSSSNNDGRMCCCNYAINCSQGILSQLANKARALGLSVDNVEYRYCRVAGIGPLLSNLQSKPDSFASSASITIGSLYKEVMDEIEKIRLYDDGKMLNGVYKNVLNQITHALSKIAFHHDKQCSVAQYCSRLHQKRYRDELEKLCVFDSALIDMKIVHSIVSSPNVSSILVIAGGSHIEQVCDILARIGYTSVFATADPVSPPSIKNILNSSAASSPSANKPLPVDLSLVDKYIFGGK